MITFSVLANHHFLYLFFLLDCALKVPFLCLELFVFLLDGLNLGGYFLDFLLEMGDPLVSFFANLFNLLFQRFYLVFIYLGIFFR